MKTNLLSMITVSVALLAGCGATTSNQAPQTAVAMSGMPDPARAYDKATGECVARPEASAADYKSCLDLKAQEKPAPGGGAVAGGVPMGAPSVPMTTKMIPFAAGRFCEAPMGTGVSIRNLTSFALDWMSSDVAPLNCDAPYTLYPGCVTLAGGGVHCNGLIPPGMEVQFVYVYRMNGMVAQLPSTMRINFTGHVNVPTGPQTGKMVSKWWMPKANPKGVNIVVLEGELIDTSASLLRLPRVNDAFAIFDSASSSFASFGVNLLDG